MRTMMRPRLTPAAASAALPPLPPGFSSAARSTPPARTRPEPPPAPAPAVSGVLTAVTATCGCTPTVHRGGYDVQSPQGGWTVHGYAWRCPGCARLAVGYLPQDGFRRALTDARDHQCPRGGVCRG